MSLSDLVSEMAEEQARFVRDNQILDKVFHETGSVSSVISRMKEEMNDANSNEGEVT